MKTVIKRLESSELVKLAMQSWEKVRTCFTYSDITKISGGKYKKPQRRKKQEDIKL